MISFETREGMTFIKEKYVKRYGAHKNELKIINDQIHEYEISQTKFEPDLMRLSNRIEELREK